MSLLLKFVVTIVLVGLLMAGLLNVLSALFANVSSDSFPRLRNPDDEAEYDEHEMLVSGRERDRAALSRSTVVAATLEQ